jgi:hypothetical protein
MYFIATRPEILFVVSLLSQVMHCAREMHLKAAKRILRYIKKTVNYSVKFETCQSFRLCGFSYSDQVESIDDMKSTLGYYFSLGSEVFSWCSEKQEIVAQTTTKAECIVATTTIINQVLWLKKKSM